MSLGEMQQDLRSQVQEHAAALLAGLPDDQQPLDFDFIRECLAANERGDGVLYATLHSGKYLYNTTPKDGEWYRWAEHVWKKDDFRQAFGAVEDVALEYLRYADHLQVEIDQAEIEDKDHKDYWKVVLHKQLVDRAKRLRSVSGAQKALTWAPVVAEKMACRESDFDQSQWLLPCKNGIINLETGVLLDGRPEDMLTRQIDVAYDPQADMEPWLEFLADVAVDDKVVSSQDVPNFLKRVFGYAATGFSHEQYIFCFCGPGRNGKGVLFNLISSVLGPYYHEISRGMILEQRNEPSPGAASEHKYSLLGKRLIVGAETNKGQKIDASAVKGITGKNNILARPNFGKEIVFSPTHTLFLQTNNIPYGLTSEFSLVQRLMLIDFPWMYVDDPVAEGKKYPGQADRFRQKDPHLEEQLAKYKQGILRWIVEGAREWAEVGLKPPACILEAVNKLAKEEDYIGQFIADCLVHKPGEMDLSLPCTSMYNAFLWWCSENREVQDKRKIPAMKTINKSLRERGFRVDQVGGRTKIFEMAINSMILDAVNEFLSDRSRKS